MSFNNVWITENKEHIVVNDMTLSHVKNVLNMLINKYTLFCINLGAKYASGININEMSETEARNMLNKTCQDRSYLKYIVAEKCFGPYEWSFINN